jgi:hypothetical protein
MQICMAFHRTISSHTVFGSHEGSTAHGDPVQQASSVAYIRYCCPTIPKLNGEGSEPGQEEMCLDNLCFCMIFLKLHMLVQSL